MDGSASATASPPAIPRAARAGASPRAARVLFWLLVFVLCAIGWGKMDVWLAEWFHFSIGGSSSGVFRVLVAGYLGARLYSRDFRLRPATLRDPIVWLAAVALLSPLWNFPDPAWPVKAHDTAEILSIVLPGLTAYLAVRWLLDGDFDGYGVPVLRAIACGLSLVSLQILLTAPTVLQDFSQVDSMFEHHTHVAMRMVMAIPLTIGLLLHERIPAWRWVYCIMLLFQIVAVTVSNSRIGWLALGVVGVYGAFYGASPRMRRMFAIALVAMVALAFSFPKVRANFMTIFDLPNQENFVRRTVVYGTNLKLIGQHPVLGIGYSSRTFLYAGRAIEGEQWEYEHPHNLFLQIPVYLGIPGAICFVWILVSISRAALTIGRRAPPGTEALAFGVRGALIGLLMMNVAETALSSERIAFMMPMLLALVFSWNAHLQPTAGNP